MKIQIYTLSDETGVRYVGQSNSAFARLSTHFCEAGSGRDKTKKGEWLRSVMGENRDFSRVRITIIEECDDKRANEREKYWINQFTNLTNSK